MNGAGFVLFVEHGRLSVLEGYSYDEAWNEEPKSFVLSYLDPLRRSVYDVLDAS